MKKYEKEKASYIEQIDLAKQKQEEYRNYSEYINSEEYIEKIAREKLGMLLPEERIYIEIQRIFTSLMPKNVDIMHKMK